MTMDEVRNKVHELIDKSYKSNCKSIPWSGMHDQVVDRIIDLIDLYNTEVDEEVHNHPMGVGFGHKDIKSSGQILHEHKPQSIRYDKLKHFADGFHSGDYQIDRYWDEPEGKEI